MENQNKIRDTKRNIKNGATSILVGIGRTLLEGAISMSIWNFVIASRIGETGAVSYIEALLVIIMIRLALGQINVQLK